MRKYFAALLLSLLLTGCAAPSEETAPSAAPEESAVQSRTAQAESMSSSLVESSARPLVEPEILAAYDRAVRVYSWFDLAPLPVSEESTVIDSRLYHRVDMNGITDMDDLRAYLRGVFSRELTDRLLDGKTARIQYRESDGALYVYGDSRERNPSAGAAYVTAEQLDGTTYAVNVLLDLLDEDRETVVGLESWSFPYSFVDDRWVFTEFRLIY